VSLAKQVPAGLLDSGLAAFANFAVGVFAVRYFTAAELGIYSLFFSAVYLASVVPANLVFLPARVRMLSAPQGQRLASYGSTVRTGAVSATSAALVVVLALPSALSATDDLTFLVPLVATAYVAACLSPQQDHLRSLMHHGGASWSAAVVSLVQAIVTTVVIIVALVADIPPTWVPFGGLIAANATSLAVGIALLRSQRDSVALPAFAFADLARAGRWLVTTDLLREGADFVARMIVLALTTAEILGIAAGARIAARPVDVFVLGITAVVAPRSMRAGRERDAGDAGRLARVSYGAVIVVGVAYLAAAGGDWPWNLMARLAPIGYTIDGLVAFTIVASVAAGLLFVERTQLIGGQRERSITTVEVAAVVVGLVSVVSVVAIGAFALPLMVLVSSVVRWIGYRRALRRLRGSRVPDDTAVPTR
jgi:hypothetical protein